MRWILVLPVAAALAACGSTTGPTATHSSSLPASAVASAGHSASPPIPRSSSSGAPASSSAAEPPSPEATATLTAQPWPSGVQARNCVQHNVEFSVSGGNGGDLRLAWTAPGMSGSQTKPAPESADIVVPAGTRPSTCGDVTVTGSLPGTLAPNGSPGVVCSITVDGATVKTGTNGSCRYTLPN